MKKNEKQILTDLTLSQGPHICSKQNINVVMWLVVAALTPAFIKSIFTFGTKAIYLTAACVITAVLSEIIIRKLLKRNTMVKNGSAILTGILLAFNLPPDFPIWMAVIGTLFAVVVVKELFGGLGHNIWNPALAGRAFLLASWPTEMTGAWHKFSSTNVLAEKISNAANLPVNAFDALTSATPLAVLKEVPAKFSAMGLSSDKIYDAIFTNSVFSSLFDGIVGGCIGETSAMWLLVGALLLLLTKVITWHTPFSFIGSFSIITYSYYLFTGFPLPGEALLYHVLAGGLILGAFFMATDMVTSPINPKGMVFYGMGCGILTAVIRLWGGYPEGVSYSILLMNTAVPLIDRWTDRKIYGS